MTSPVSSIILSFFDTRGRREPWTAIENKTTQNTMWNTSRARIRAGYRSHDSEYDRGRASEPRPGDEELLGERSLERCQSDPDDQRPCDKRQEHAISIAGASIDGI